MEPAVLRRTQDTLGKVIRKPPLTDKLLGKPPFRYLHDILTEVIRTTGFFKGLYTETELKSDNVKDKDAKISFLQKAIDVVVIVTGQPLAVKPARIVAGHEPERTNELLQAIGRCCLEKQSSDDAVRRVLAGEKPDPKGKSSSTSKSQDKVNRDAKDEERKSQKEKEDRRESENRERSGSRERKDRVQVKEEKRHSEKERERKKENERDRVEEAERNGHREGEKTDKEKSRVKESRSESERDKSRDKAERDRVRDRRTEGRGIEKDRTRDRDREKGKEREKDHDKERNKERDPEREKRKERGKEDESQRGREEGRTREQERAERKSKGSEEKKVSEVSVKESKSAADKEISVIGEEKPPSTSKTARPSASKLRERRPARLEGEGESGSDRETEATEPPIPETKEVPNEQPANATQSRRISRPGSARPAPPRVKRQPSAEAPVLERVGSGKGVTSVIVDKKKEDDDDDEEFVVEEAPPQLPDMPVMEMGPDLELHGDEKHGGLVKKILETKKDYETQPDADNKEKLLLSDASRKKEKDIVTKEIERLRGSIQTLCRSALPLGKIMDYIQEDMDTMQNELQMWRQENRQHAKALLQEQSVTDTAVEPLKAELAELEQLIKEQQDKICTVKGNILRNEEKIQNMVHSINMSSRV
ncbi:TRAF3-interacting protein 1 [Rhinophrynus dorsalis]